MGFVATLSCYFMVKLGYPLGWSLVLGLLIGAGVGIVNGFLISAVGINPLITTLGMGTFLLGLGFTPNGAQPIFGLPPDYVKYLGAGDWGPIPAPVCIAAIVVALAWLVQSRSKAGVYIYAIGGSRDTCRVAGVPIVRYGILAYLICGLLAGLAGLMLGARISIVNADIGVNSGYSLDSIATAVIGGALIGGGVGRLSGVVLGVSLLTVLETGLDIAKVHDFVQEMIEGVVLISAVLIAQLRAGQIRDVARVLRIGRAQTVTTLESVAASRRAAG
jgi:ribose transport system permease protein